MRRISLLSLSKIQILNSKRREWTYCEVDRSRAKLCRDDGRLVELLVELLRRDESSEAAGCPAGVLAAELKTYAFYSFRVRV